MNGLGSPWVFLSLFGASFGLAAGQSPASLPLATDSTAQQALADVIDGEIAAAGLEHALPIAPPADDAVWLRRLSLDVCGTIPEGREISLFLGDSRADKRSRKIEEYLESSAFSESLSCQWVDLLEGAAGKDAEVMKLLLRPWLERQFESRVPFSSTARQLISDSDQDRRPGSISFLLTYRDSIETLTAVTARVFLGLQVQCAQCHDHPTDRWKRDDFNGFAGFFLDMRGDHVSGSQGGGKGFRIFDRSPEWDLIDRLRRLTTRSTKQAAADVEMRYEMQGEPRSEDITPEMSPEMSGSGMPPPRSPEARGDKIGELAALNELLHLLGGASKSQSLSEVLDSDPTRRDVLLARIPPEACDLITRYRDRKTLFGTPRFLDGSPCESPANGAKRVALADWILSPDNPWFGPAIVNRVWGHFLGKGFVEPIDDLSGSNDRVLPQLLDRLGREFISHDTDLRFLIGAIVRTHAYARGNSSTEDLARRTTEERWFTAHPLRPFNSEQTLTSLRRATGVADDRARRAADAHLERKWTVLVKEIDSFSSDDPVAGGKLFTANIPQSLFLMNGEFANEAEGVALARFEELFRSSEDDVAGLRRMFLSTLGRPPTEVELDTTRSYLRSAERDVGDGVADVFWALLNSAEFQTNR